MWGKKMESVIHVRFPKGMIKEVDQVVDPSIGYTRSLFIREAVKERLNKMSNQEATV